MTRLFAAVAAVFPAGGYDASNDDLRTQRATGQLEWECPVNDELIQPDTFIALAKAAFEQLGAECRGVEVRSDSVVIYLTADYED